MAAATLDIPQLSIFCSLPQNSITTLVDAPTAELVRKLLQNISAKASKYKELESDKVRGGVELENAIRGQEARTKTLRSKLEKVQNENTTLRQKVQSEELSKSALEAEIHELRRSTSTSTSVISDLNARIESLEASNREKLSLLDSKSTAYDRLVGELNAQHQKTVEARKKLSECEQSLEAERSALSAALFREQNLRQSIEQLERRNEYLDGELKAKSSEYTKFRKEKHQEISQLERQNEEDSSKIRQLQSREVNLRRTIEEISEKADERSQRVQTIQEEFVQKENAFQFELDAANRLAKLRETSAITERERVHDLTEQLESFRQNNANEFGRIQAELETEHIAREEAETKIAELEVQIERLRDEIANQPAPVTGSSTPLKGVNGFSALSPERGDLTPQSQSPGSARLKGKISVTRLVSENSDLKHQISIERRKNEELTEAMSSLITDMESQAPEIEDLKTEHSRLETEVADLSSLVDAIGKERDQAVKAVKRQEGQVEAKAREGEILRQQLRDLSSQVKMLLIESQVRKEGRSDLSADDRVQLERLAQQNLEDESGEEVTDTNRYISLNLVPFRNTVELQEQNSKLLKLTRELGERMEHEEALRVQAEAARNWEELQQKYERCKDEMQSLVTQSQSYIRERDMFRTMLENRGQLPLGSEFGSVNGDRSTFIPSQAHVAHSIEGASPGDGKADYAKLVRDMQAHFDAYRNEATTDKMTLKQQIDDLLKSQNELRSEASRSNSQAMLAHDRYEMLQTNFTMLRNENTELHKRSQTLYESAAKQDLRVQQVAEDLVEARGTIDSMRNEVSNLKAEKDFWKTVEKRINDDNESLIQERGRLNSLNASLQSLLNERERSEAETRRRLQTQVDNLETELQKSRASLNEEAEESKRAASRREFESEQQQKRIDDLVSSLGAMREKFAKANTAKEHLSHQVEEMKIELRSAKERLEVLQSTQASLTSTGAASSLGTGEKVSTLSSEQELKVRISEIQRDLDLAKKESEDMRSLAEQYQAISQASEDQLNSLNKTHDLFHQETEKIVKEKDAKIGQLEQRIQDVLTELGSLNSEVGELRNQQAEHDRTLNEQRREFDTKVAQLTDQDDRHATEASFLKQDLKTQADIAQQAQQNYENELVKHADAAKALQRARIELNDVKTELLEAKTMAETARLNLNQNEESWNESQERFEREIRELRGARQGLKEQNNRLHQQIETLNVAHKHVESVDHLGDRTSSVPGLENLQEIVKYLRREKDIVDIQLELSSQEAKRLKQQLNYTQSQLDDARLKLQQQCRIEADKANTALAHQKLMETVQDLNTQRESNVTLRAEAKQAQASLATRNKEVEDLRAQIEPLQDQVQELKGEREAHEEEVKILKENADRWQQRAQNVLQKYDRVDPAEIDALKEQIRVLENERGELSSAKQAIQQQLDAAESQIAQAQEQATERVQSLRSRLEDQFKTRSKILSDRVKDKDAQLQTAINEKLGLEERLAGLSDMQAELDSANAERDAAVQKAAKSSDMPESDHQTDGEEGEVTEGGDAKSADEAVRAVQTKLEAAEKRIEGEADVAAALRSELSESKGRVAELEAQVARLQNSIGELDTEISHLRASQPQLPEGQDTTVDDTEIQKLKQDLSDAQQKLESLQSAGPINVTIANSATDAVAKSITDQVAEHAEAVRKELERRHDERVKQHEDTYNKKAENLRKQLSQKLSENRDKARESVEKEQQQALQALKSQHEQEIQQLQARHKDEIDELRRHEESRFIQMRTEWEKEHQNNQANNSSDEVKAEDPRPGADWKPTDQEARTLVQSNEVVNRIVKQNILNQVRKQNEILTKRLKEEHEKQLDEAQARANTAKEHAVMMEGKKNALQLNMANSKVRLSQFKLELVQKAAQDTPEKSVKVVWDRVKDAKPPQSTPATKPPASSASTVEQSTVAAQESSAPATVQAQAPSSGLQVSATAPAVFGQPKPNQPKGEFLTTTNGTQQQGDRKLTSTQSPTSKTNPFQRPAASGPAQKQQTAANSTAAGGGLAAAKPLQSGLPVPRGGANRGIQRGRGGGLGYGGPGIDTSKTQGQPQGRGSPVSGGMNPAAKQFVPGNKRPREDAQDGTQGGDGPGKRIKGGADG